MRFPCLYIRPALNTCKQPFDSRTIIVDGIGCAIVQCAGRNTTLPLIILFHQEWDKILTP